MERQMNEGGIPTERIEMSRPATVAQIRGRHEGMQHDDRRRLRLRPKQCDPRALVVRKESIRSARAAPADEVGAFRAKIFERGWRRKIRFSGEAFAFGKI